MSNIGIGNLITTEAQKDAIHMAVAPVIASERLKPGAHIGLAVNGLAVAIGRKDKDCIGIVDPFLRQDVNPGERFWLFLYPGTIVALRHEWSHPAFGRPTPPDPDPVRLVPIRPAAAAETHPASAKSESEKWIRNLGHDAHLDYAVLLAAADNWIMAQNRGKWGDYIDVPCSLNLPEEFWNHYQIVRGLIVPEDRRGSFFNCTS